MFFHRNKPKNDAGASPAAAPAAPPALPPPEGPCFPAEPDLRSTCEFCHRRCRVPVTHSMPRAVSEAYERVGWRTMATCEVGARHEHGMLGASYEDVINERCSRRAPEESERTRCMAQDLRDAAREVREQVTRDRARADQVAARARDVVEQAKRDAARRKG